MTSRLLVGVIFIAGITGLVIYVALSRSVFSPEISPLAVATTVTSNSLPAQIDEQGTVVVEVVPISIEPDAPWQFAINLNTHEVELDD
ncbi:MAG: hypothetical protein AAB817_02925, partial [Patescibacteria group bacterium]